MPIFAENFSWMSQNALLAFIPIVLVVILRQKLNIFVHLIFFFFWLIFLPNTVYLVTDLQHLPNQLLKAKDGDALILLIQYAILASFGVMTYVYSLEPVSKIFKKIHLPEVKREISYIAINYIIAFGVMIGKFQRTHSWYIFTDTKRVISDIIETGLTLELLGWVFVFGSIVNVIFFLFKDYFPPLRSKKN